MDKRSRDRDKLFLRDGQVGDRTIEFYGNANFIEYTACHRQAGGATDQAPALMQLVRQPNVLSCREVGKERKILINTLDTRLDPFDWRASGPVDILDEQQAFVCPLHACDDPDQG